MEIRDPIHGFIKPPGKIQEIINTFAFQRLRRVRQLALAHLAYPGANHTRFDHSLGVFHVATKMAEETLKNDGDIILLVQMAAILHDLGHPPFSHVSETILSRFYDYGTESEKEKVHELITANLINCDPQLERILSVGDRNNINGLLSGNILDFSLMKEIVSGPIDADKMDYLLRDEYYCGVKYGEYDIARILNTLCIIPDGRDKHLGIKSDGINCLEQFLLAKYYMTTQVYFHKIRTLTDAMIVRGIILGIEADEIEFLKKLYIYQDSPEYLENYKHYWDDKVIMEILYREKHGLAYDMFKRITERNLFTRVFSCRLKDLNLPEVISDKLINITSKSSDELRISIENDISSLNYISCRPEYVIANCFTLKSFGEVYNHSENEILIKNEDDTVEQFTGKSLIFDAIEETITETKIEVYAPLSCTDKRDKNKKIETLEKDIYKIFKALGDGK